MLIKDLKDKSQVRDFTFLGVFHNALPAVWEGPFTAVSC